MRSQNCEKWLLASSCLSVRLCPSVRPHGLTRLPLDGFTGNLIFEYFSKISRENSSFIKVWQNNQNFTRHPTYVYDHVSLSSYNEKYFTQNLFSNFLPKIVPFKIRCKNTVEPERPQMTTWHMRFACWLTEATNTHSEYVILIAFPLLLFHGNIDCTSVPHFCVILALPVLSV